MHGRQPQRVVAVGVQIARDRDSELAIGSGEAPLVAPGRTGIDQAIVVREVGRLARRSMRREVCGRAGHHHAVGRDAASDERRIRHRHVADGEIKAFLHQVDHAIGHGHADRDVGIERHELRNHRREERRNRDRGVEAQGAARARLQRLGDLVGVVRVRQDLQAALVVGVPHFGQTHTPRAAIEQPNV